jgi:ABC-type Fe3+-hydroxamate transport system substrate-binding protein
VTVERIVSLVPSLTELVWWLGRGEWLVGRTRFCTEPAGQVEAAAIVGGTKNPHVDRIVALAPTLVMANREENRREDVEGLRAAGLDVMLTDPNTVDEALAMIVGIGERLAASGRAAELVRDTNEALAERPPARPPRVYVAVWQAPDMGLGAESYGHDLLSQAGAENVLAGRPRYPAMAPGELERLKPDLILLPDEPFPFKERDIPPFAAVAPARLIDGRLLWWYGPRMPEAIRRLRAMFEEPR